MESDKVKRYVVGSPEKLAETFPHYNGNDIRTSLDKKQAIYEVNIPEESLAVLKKNPAIKFYTDKEILLLIDAPASAGVWFPKAKDPKPKP